MHPFLVWLLSSRHETLTTSQLAVFARRNRVFANPPKDDLDAVLDNCSGRANMYSEKSSLLAEDTAVAWVEYQTWLAAAHKGRAS